MSSSSLAHSCRVRGGCRQGWRKQLFQEQLLGRRKYMGWSSCSVRDRLWDLEGTVPH